MVSASAPFWIHAMNCGRGSFPPDLLSARPTVWACVALPFSAGHARHDGPSAYTSLSPPGRCPALPQFAELTRPSKRSQLPSFRSQIPSNQSQKPSLTACFYDFLRILFALTIFTKFTRLVVAGRSPSPCGRPFPESTPGQESEDSGSSRPKWHRNINSNQVRPFTRPPHAFTGGRSSQDVV